MNRHERSEWAMQVLAPVLGFSVLTNLMAHPSRPVRDAAAKVLGLSTPRKSPIAPDFFVQAMRSGPNRVREAAILGFDYWSVIVPEAGPALVQCLGSQDQEVRLRAAQAFSPNRHLYFRDCRVVSALTRRMQDPDPEVRQSVRKMVPEWLPANSVPDQRPTTAN